MVKSYINYLNLVKSLITPLLLTITSRLSTVEYKVPICGRRHTYFGYSTDNCHYNTTNRISFTFLRDKLLETEFTFD